MKKLVIIIALLILPLIYQSTPTEIIKLRTFDALIEKHDPSGNFVILNLDEKFIEQEGGYPLPRQRLAEIHNEIINAGAIGVGWVISFPQADRMGGDLEFAQALSSSPSVIAMFQDNAGKFPKPTGTVVKGKGSYGILTKGVKENLNTLSNNTLQGLAIAPTEIDNLVRRIPLLVKTPNDDWIPSFGTQIYKALFGVRTYIISTNEYGIEEIAIRGIPPVKTDSLGRKWISWVKTPETTLQELDVAHKFVFIGVTANGVMPQIATPVGLLEPHKIQSALAESILIPSSPYIPDWSLTLEIVIFVVCVALIWLTLNALGITWGLVAFLVLMLSTAYGGFYLIRQGLLIDVSWTLISMFITGAIAFYLRFREQYKLRLQIKKQFEHYLDPRQVKKLQNNPDLLKLGGEKKYATFLFTDVRGFTAMSEKLEPEQVTYIMNKALTVQQKAVQKNQGMVDKYIGDAMMAIFNAPLDLNDHEMCAIDCAKDIQEGMIELNKELEEQNIPPVQIGIGINSGYAIIGNMGSEGRFDYTAIGDAVNTGARLESGTKDAGVDVLIGESTEKNVIYKLKALKPIKAKGKSDPLKVYTIT